MFDEREYQKQLLLYCLHLESPLSASELCHNMALISQQEMHPRVCWDGLTSPYVARLVKELVISRHVTRSSIDARNANGRPEARWELTMKCDVRPLPRPPFYLPSEESPKESKAHKAVDTEGVELTFRLTEERAESLRRIVKDVNIILEQYDKIRNLTH